MILRSYIATMLALVVIPALTGCQSFGEAVENIGKEIQEDFGDGRKDKERKSTGNTRSPTNKTDTMPSKQKLSSYDKDLVIKVQERLYALGYPTGKADGLWGNASRSAMRDYQRDRGLKQTGEFDVETLKSMGIDSGVRETSLSDKPRVSPPSDEPFKPEVVATKKSPVEKPTKGIDDDLFSVQDNSVQDDVEKNKGGELTVIKSMRAKTRLNLFSEPDPFSAVLTSVPKAAKLGVISESSGWYRVQYKKQTGFVEKNALE